MINFYDLEYRLKRAMFMLREADDLEKTKKCIADVVARLHNVRFPPYTKPESPEEKLARMRDQQRLIVAFKSDVQVVCRTANVPFAKVMP